MLPVLEYVWQKQACFWMYLLKYCVVWITLLCLDIIIQVNMSSCFPTLFTRFSCVQTALKSLFCLHWIGFKICLMLKGRNRYLMTHWLTGAQNISLRCDLITGFLCVSVCASISILLYSVIIIIILWDVMTICVYFYIWIVYTFSFYWMCVMTGWTKQLKKNLWI